MGPANKLYRKNCEDQNKTRALARFGHTNVASFKVFAYTVGLETGDGNV
jgi:hypothetical protein